jgi:hypothetical protein
MAAPENNADTSASNRLMAAFKSACKRAGIVDFTALLPAHLGVLALHRQPRSQEAASVGRLENAVDALAVCPHQCGRTAGFD